MSHAPMSAMKEAVLLHAEDRHRMTRLYEEVLTRLEEMAILNGLKLTDRVTKGSLLKVIQE